MAKIHNPQDQKGVDLINQTTFDGEVSLREAGDTLLQTNIDNEITARQTAVEGEKTRAEAAEADISAQLTAEINRSSDRDDLLEAANTAEATAREAADTAETARAVAKENELSISIATEVARATAKENFISATIEGNILNFSTNELTDGTYSTNVNEPSAINLHHSVIPTGIINSIEIPNSNITAARYLNIKVVDGVSDTEIDYTSTNSSTSKWLFNNFIKNENLADNVYYKLVLTNTPAGALQYFGRNFPVNNGNFANSGLGGNWPNPTTSLTDENGVTGLPLINFEYKLIGNVKDKIETLESTLNEAILSLEAEDIAIKADIQDAKTSIETEIENRILGDSLINSAITDEVTRATAAENELSIIVDSINDQLLDIEGKVEFTTLEQQPTSTSQWIAIGFKGDNNLLNQISNKPLRSISFKVANTVTTPHYLGVYDTRVSGTKKLIAISKKTTWVANESVTFAFNEPIVIPGEFELFLLSEPISGNHTQDLPAPSVFVESYTTTGTQNYRLPTGSWAGSSSGARRGFYVTFNFVADRLGTLENEVSSHTVDTVKHITAEERTNWNSKATIENINEIVSNSLQNIKQPYKFQRDKDVEPTWVDTTIAGNFTGGATEVELLPYTQPVESVNLIVKYHDAEVYNSNGYVSGTELPSKITIDGSNYISVSFAKHSDISFTGDLTLRFVGSATVAESTRFILADVFGSSDELSFNKNSSYTAATFTIPQNATKVDVSNGSKTETYIVGQSKPSSHTLYTVSGNTLTARAQGESGNSLTTTSYIPSNQPLNEVIDVTLNDGQIITANVVSMNKNIVVDSFNTGEKQITINTTINKPSESLVSHIIVDSICDSAAYDNAQHVCHVIPVRITL